MSDNANNYCQRPSLRRLNEKREGAEEAVAAAEAAAGGAGDGCRRDEDSAGPSEGSGTGASPCCRLRLRRLHEGISA